MRPATAALLDAADRGLTYADLRRLVDARRAELGPTRRLVLLEAGNDVETVVTYLAALAGRHPVLLAAPGDIDRHAELVRPLPTRRRPAVGAPLGSDAPAPATTSTPTSRCCSARPAPPGRPSWSGSRRPTSLANARSIADVPRPPRRPTGRSPRCRCTTATACRCSTATWSVGAAVVLTDLSVADACFWELAAQRPASTSLAGVPYTFDLLDASGFAERDAARRCAT